MSCRICLGPLEPNSSLGLSIILPIGKSIEEIIRFFIPEMITLKLDDWLLCPKCVDDFLKFTNHIAKSIAIASHLNEMVIKEEEPEIISEDSTELPDGSHIYGSNDEDPSGSIKVIQSKTRLGNIEVITEVHPKESNMVKRIIRYTKKPAPKKCDVDPALPVPKESIKNGPSIPFEYDISVTEIKSESVDLNDTEEDKNVTYIIDSDTDNENLLAPLNAVLGDAKLEFNQMVRLTKTNEELAGILNELTNTSLNLIDLRSTRVNTSKRILLVGSKEEEINSQTVKLKKCPICGGGFSTGCTLEKHFQANHKDYYAFQCVICGKKFKRTYAYNKHLEHYEKYQSCNVRKCPICEEIVVGENFSIHMKKHKSLQCNVCTRKFVTPFALRKHRMRHDISQETAETYKPKLRRELCTVCGKLTSSGAAMRSHMKTHLQGPKFLCDQCPKILKSNGGLKKHKETVHARTVLECPVCKKKITKRGLSAHISLKHSNKEPSHKCHICGKSFRRGDYYRKHLNSHSVLIRTSRRRYRRRHEVAEFPCKFCDRTYENVYKLRIHLISSHLKNARRPKCQFCSMTFRDKSSRARHEKKHTDPLSFELTCKVCWNKFDDKGQLEAHLLKHKKSHECDECGESFPSKYLLYHHANEKHYNEKVLEQRRTALLEDGLCEFVSLEDVTGWT